LKQLYHLTTKETEKKMNPEYKILKTRCSICGKSYKKVTTKDRTEDTTNFVVESFGSDIGPVCKTCERKYRVIGSFHNRGYGYKWSTAPSRTAMDKESTPTFGIEIEVAGNIKSIEKIDKISNDVYMQQECSIGYDSSLSGAQFELSYAPGTFYWYMYESKFKNVCKLLEKDPMAKTDETTGMHIHIGTIQTGDVYVQLQKAASTDNMFWTIIKIIGERDFNRYCMPIWQRQHHDCINRSERWRTLEFRMFASTFDYNKILNRMKFLRQMIENFSYTGPIMWHNFKEPTKEWFMSLLETTKLDISEEEKQKIRLLFSEEGHAEAMPINKDAEFWMSEAEHQYMEDEQYSDDDYEEDEEEEEYQW